MEKLDILAESSSIFYKLYIVKGNLFFIQFFLNQENIG